VHFEAALKRLDAMDDTQPIAWRRIDAVVKQAEIKFALGTACRAHPRARAIRGLVDETIDRHDGAAWYCWTGVLHSLTGARPEVTIAYCQEGSCHCRGRPSSRRFAPLLCCLWPGLCVTQGGCMMHSRPVIGLAHLRGALKRLVGMPHLWDSASRRFRSVSGRAV